MPTRPGLPAVIALRVPMLVTGATATQSAAYFPPFNSPNASGWVGSILTAATLQWRPAVAPQRVSAATPTLSSRPRRTVTVKSTEAPGASVVPTPERQVHTLDSIPQDQPVGTEPVTVVTPGM
ncbi:hypothetical protein D3C81_792990 [compost metagenome]